MSEVIVSMIDQCLARERLERRLAEAAENSAAHDEHFMLAERYADRAWALAENNDVPYVASPLWDRTSDREIDASFRRGATANL